MQIITLEKREGKKLTLEAIKQQYASNKEIFDYFYLSNNTKIGIITRGKKANLMFQEVVNFIHKNGYGYAKIVFKYDNKDYLNDIYITLD